jgi:NAD(P)-dependent dehydrogenase (short-subunit alcohol dehydrogenase family)
MSVRELAGSTAVVTGASRGFGRATTITLAALGARVVGVARSEQALDELKGQLGDEFVPEVADATDPDVPARLLSVYEPQILVLNAGAVPRVGALQDQTWDTFGVNWQVDVRHVFNFTREALRSPLAPGSAVVSVSSGAAVRGSPLSGGYAGAKATIKFISSYAGSEAQRNGTKTRFVAVLPPLTPATDLGRVGAEAYATRAGVSVREFAEGLHPTLDVDQVAKEIVDLASDDSYTAPAYLVTPRGLEPMD